jgi:predicted ATPase
LYNLKVTKLEMCDGTQINPGSLTVFIGPNNAGKTRALRDILNDLQGSSLEQVVIKHVESTRSQTFNELKESDYQSFFEPTEQGSRWQDLGADLCSQQVASVYVV